MPNCGADSVQTQNGEFFNSPVVERLIADYQANGELATLSRIMSHCQSIPLSLIRRRRTAHYADEGELLSTINRKLLVSLPQYDPSRGSAFSWISRLSLNMLATEVTYSRKLAGRYEPLTAALVATRADSGANFTSRIALDDLHAQIRGIKSVQELGAERDAQKWYVESFIDAGFELRRHECADAAMKVYGLTHRRSRQLYDLTLLEVRRLLWDETKHASVTPGQLRGTKGVALIRYSNFLTPEEFNNLAVLMKDLAPTLVILVRPANKAAIQRGEWPAVRENLELVLDGDPQSTRLF